MNNSKAKVMIPEWDKKSTNRSAPAASAAFVATAEI